MLARTGSNFVRSLGKPVISTGLKSNRQFVTLTNRPNGTVKSISGKHKVNPLWMDSVRRHSSQKKGGSGVLDPDGKSFTAKQKKSVTIEEVVKRKLEAISEMFNEVSDMKTKDKLMKNELLFKSGSVEDYSNCDPKKFDKIFNLYEPQMSKYTNWSKDVDRALCSRGTLLFRQDPESKRASFMNIVSGNGKKLLPITYLPTKISWGNGDEIEYKTGIINDEEGIARFIAGYGDNVGEGTHFHASTYEDLLLILAKAFSDSQKREFDSVLVAVSPLSKADELFYELGLREAKDDNHINLCTYLGGKIEGVPTFDVAGSATKITTDLNVPQLTTRDGKNIQWKYISISRKAICDILENELRDPIVKLLNQIDQSKAVDLKEAGFNDNIIGIIKHANEDGSFTTG